MDFFQNPPDLPSAKITFKVTGTDDKWDSLHDCDFKRKSCIRSKVYRLYEWAFKRKTFRDGILSSSKKVNAAHESLHDAKQS